MTLALSLYLFQNDSGLRGNNGLSGLQNLPGLDGMPQSTISIWFLWASALALGLGYILCAWVVSGKFGSVLRGIRDDEARVRFLGYSVRGLQAFHFHVDCRHRGHCRERFIILRPVSSIRLRSPLSHPSTWRFGLLLAGAGDFYGAVIGAAFVSLLSTWFTGGQARRHQSGLLHGSMGRLVDDPSGPVVCRGHIVCTTRHRWAVRPAFRTSAAGQTRGRSWPGCGCFAGTGGREVSALLEVSGVSVSFDGFKAINNLSFQIAEGELRAVIGPNGAGKTTFMDIITGKTRPDEGRVIYGEKSQSLLRMSEATDRAGRDRAQISAPGLFSKIRVWPTTC